MNDIAQPKNTRLYKVDTAHGPRLVEAGGRRQAVMHVVRADRKRMVATLAQSHEVHQLAKSGIEIEVAGADGELSDTTKAALAQEHLDV